MSDSTIDKPAQPPREDSVFVFGSNLSGRHGAGAAYDAWNLRGYPHGLGSGYHSRCYGIPTKDCQINTLHGDIVTKYVSQFIDFARMTTAWDKPGLIKFQVTRVGCGLAGFKDEDIAQMFKGAPTNCYFDEKWKLYLGSLANYWGTF